jgi:type I restriction enzyme S subunit
VSGKLPNGWFWSTIGEVCHNPQYGWTTKASEAGSLRIVRTTDITSGVINWDNVPFCEKEPENKEKYLLKDGDIVISRAGSVGYSLLIKSPQHSVFASYLIRFMPIINENFVAYFLKSPYYWNSISETKIGIAVSNVNATKLKKISVPIPPQSEQHRIVAKIEEFFTKLDAGVDALKR